MASNTAQETVQQQAYGKAETYPIESVEGEAMSAGSRAGARGWSVGQDPGSADLLQVVAGLASAIRRLDSTLSDIDHEARKRDELATLELRDLQRRLRDTATETRLADFRRETLSQLDLVNAKLDRMMAAAR